MLKNSIISFLYNVFNPINTQITPFVQELICCLQTPYIWTCLKFCHLVKGSSVGFMKSAPSYKTNIRKSVTSRLFQS